MQALTLFLHRRERVFFWIAAAALIVCVRQLAATGDAAILYFIYGVLPVSSAYASFRAFGLIRRLAEKGLREELALTRLGAREILKLKFFAPLLAALAPAWVLGPIAILARYAIEMFVDLLWTGGSPLLDCLALLWIYLIPPALACASGVLICFILECKSSNRGRPGGAVGLFRNAIIVTALPLLAILAAGILPSLGALGLTLLVCPFAWLMILIWLRGRLCAGFFRFEAEDSGFLSEPVGAIAATNAERKLA